jgi:hypothetical protein
LVSASIFGGEDIAGYDPAQDRDLYEYCRADNQVKQHDWADSEGERS